MNVLSIEQFELLKLLIDCPYVSSDEMTTYFDCSIRKIQLDIKEINVNFKERSFLLSIDNDRKLGYYLKVENESDFTEMRHQVFLVLENSFLRLVNRKQRVALIVREFLFSDDYIKSEQLSKKLNISMPTLSSDLKDVREVLKYYDLTLDSTPYYGMRVNGSKMNQLSALLDLFDFYGINPERALFKQEVLSQFGYEYEEIMDKRSELLDLLQLYDCFIKPSGFSRIANLLMLVKNEKFDALSLTKISNLEYFVEYKIAYQIFPNHEQHRYLLTYYLLANLDLSMEVNKKTHHFLYSAARRTSSELKAQLIKDINLELDAEKTAFDVFFIRYAIRKMFNIIELNVLTSLIDFINSKPATHDLTVNIFSRLSSDLNIPFHGALFYELAILIYNEAYDNESDYDLILGLIVSDFGIHSSTSIVRHLNLERFEIEYDVIPSYMISKVNIKKYDFVVTTSTLYEINAQEIPVFKSEYLRNSENSAIFWTQVIMNKRKENHILDQLEKYKSFEINVTDVTVHSTINEVLLEHNIIIDNVLDLLIYKFKSQLGWKKSSTMDIVLFTVEEVSNSVFDFNLVNEVEIGLLRFNNIRLIILNPHRKLLSIKQADSSISRLGTK